MADESGGGPAGRVPDLAALDVLTGVLAAVLDQLQHRVAAPLRALMEAPAGAELPERERVAHVMAFGAETLEQADELARLAREVQHLALFPPPPTDTSQLNTARRGSNRGEVVWCR